MNPTRILLTGATGFIGTRYCERLHLLHRLRLRAMVRTFNRASRIARIQAEMVAGDLMNPESIRAAIEGCDAVVHMAHSTDENGPIETRNLVGVRSAPA